MAASLAGGASQAHVGGRRGFLRAVVAFLVGMVTLPAARARAKKVAFRLDQAEELKQVGGSTRLKVKDIDLLFVRDSETTVRVFDPTCTHKACKVRFLPEQREFFCKCHKSRYDLDGAVKNGPAPKPLNRFEASLSGDRVILTLPDNYQPSAVPPPEEEHAGEEE